MSEGASNVRLAFRVNGEDHEVVVEPRRLLADVLREDLGLTGTHLGCEHGVCGACTVLIDGWAARSCLAFAVQCEGAEISTVEGLAPPGTLGPLQQAFSRHHALQCGFCTPGMLMLATDIIEHGPVGNEGEIRAAMSSNLCRCTGYEGIVAAVAEAAEVAQSAQDRAAHAGEQRPRPKTEKRDPDFGSRPRG
jgi:aerobic-type carbon monoxide dehydrogenase small subunit (CoxS/CutS family)